MSVPFRGMRMVRADQAPRLLIYGPAGIGKTTLASEFPNPVILQTEDGTPGGMEFMSFGFLETYKDLMASIGDLYEQEHDRQTVVLDSITAAQRLVYAETCERGDEKGNRKNSIEDFGYGKGYVKAGDVMAELMGALNMLRRDKNMAVIILAHSTIERFDDPETVSYDRYEIDLHDKCRGAIEREMDAILLMKSPVSVQKEDQGFNKERAVGKGGTQRWIHCTGTPAYTAKNRYKMPEKFLYVEGQGYLELSKYLPAPVAPSVTKAA